MIRSFTIFENQDGKGNVEYTVSGDLPLEEVARALVSIALRTPPPPQSAPAEKKD
jgi:hypothetical protein